MREIPDPGFAGDTGAADEVLATALAAYDEHPESSERHLGALAALQDTRVLVPVVALAEEVAADGSEKRTDMAAVLMRSRSGRTALLAFTGTESLRTWDTAGRPVPVSSRDAARSALQEGATALLLDVAGPVRYVVEDDHLHHLAAGHRLLRLGDGSWAWTAPVG